MVDRIGYLPEERGLYRKMQVRRVLRFLGELKGLAAATSTSALPPLLERLSLRGAGRLGQRQSRRAPSGMQQKVQFIGRCCTIRTRGLSTSPSPPDPINAQALKDTVVDLKKRGRTVIFSTHHGQRRTHVRFGVHHCQRREGARWRWPTYANRMVPAPSHWGSTARLRTPFALVTLPIVGCCRVDDQSVSRTGTGRGRESTRRLAGAGSPGRVDRTV